MELFALISGIFLFFWSGFSFGTGAFWKKKKLLLLPAFQGYAIAPARLRRSCLWQPFQSGLGLHRHRPVPEPVEVPGKRWQLSYTDTVVRQAHQPVQGDRAAVIHKPSREPVEGPGKRWQLRYTDAVVRQAHQPVQGDRAVVIPNSFRDLWRG